MKHLLTVTLAAVAVYLVARRYTSDRHLTSPEFVLANWPVYVLLLAVFAVWVAVSWRQLHRRS